MRLPDDAVHEATISSAVPIALKWTQVRLHSRPMNRHHPGRQATKKARPGESLGRRLEALADFQLAGLRAAAGEAVKGHLGKERNQI